MEFDHDRLDGLRRNRGQIPEHVIDEFMGGRLSRRDFIWRGALVGLSFSTVGTILSACSSSKSTSGTSGTNAAGKAGATIKVGILAPHAAPNPLLVNDSSIFMLNQVGEGLVRYGADNLPVPWLATSWKPNADGTLWTFTIRQGVKFSDGTPMTVDDVVYSVRTQADPKSSANDLSVFAGVLDPSGVEKVDEQTVAFHLKAPSGSFPAAVSSANYNLIIVPKGTDYTKWADTFIGTGPFVKTAFNQTTGATFARNPHYWGKVQPAAIETSFYADEQPMAAALQAGQIDCMTQFTVSTSPQLLGGNYNVISVKGSAHRALSMRNDMAPFTDKYLRQAVALTLDRPAIVAALFKGYAQTGNDSPFSPSFPQTDKGVPARTVDLARARQLLAQAGVPNGFAASLVTEKLQEIPQLAQIIKASAAKVGVDIALKVETSSQYYGQAVFGKSDWLDGQMSLVDYGARPVPDVFLQAPLQTTDAVSGQGSWNAAHFANEKYDSLSKQYVAAVDLAAQRKLATQIQTLLLDETPVIFPYFYDYLAATQKNIHGVNVAPGPQMFFNDATRS